MMTWQGVLLGLLCGMVVTCLIIGAILYDKQKTKRETKEEKEPLEADPNEDLPASESVGNEEAQIKADPEAKENLFAKLLAAIRKGKTEEEKEQAKTVYICNKNYGWGKRIILLLIVLLFVLFDYKIIMFDHGFKTILSPAPEISEDIVSGIAYVNDIKETYFVQLSQNHYLIVMNTGSHGLPHKSGDTADLENFRAGGLILSQLQPQVITPIPWWIYLIVFILIIGIPAPRYRIEKIS